jgi:hypothetical protein
MSSMITPAWPRRPRSESTRDDKLTDEQHLRTGDGPSADL